MDNRFIMRRRVLSVFPLLSRNNNILNLLDREGFYIDALTLYSDEKDFFLALSARLIV